LPARDVPNASNRRQQKRPPEGRPIIHNVMLIPRRFGLPVYDRRPVRLRRSRKDRGPAGRRLARGAEGAVHCPHLPVSSCRRRMRRSSATEVPATQQPTASRLRFAGSRSLRRAIRAKDGLQSGAVLMRPPAREAHPPARLRRGCPGPYPDGEAHPSALAVGKGPALASFPLVKISSILSA
jgi:hypothetical protein